MPLISLLQNMRRRKSNRCLLLAFFIFAGFLCNHIFYFEVRRWVVGPFRHVLTSVETLPPPLPPDQCLATILASLPPSQDEISLRTPKHTLRVSSLPSDCVRNFQVLNNSPLPEHRLDCFRHSNFKPEDLQTIHRDLKVLKAEFAAAKLPLFLIGGSLIGTWRVHGFIPYDTDIDFGVNYSDRSAVIALLQGLAKKDRHFRFKDVESLIDHLHLDLGCRWADDGSFLSSITFADFFYFWNTTIGVGTKEPPQHLPTKAIYPLRKRPFQGLLFDAVADYPMYFAFVYGAGLRQCQKDKGYPMCPLTDCDLLRSVLPFVVTFENSSFAAEALVREGAVQSVFTRPAG